MGVTGLWTVVQPCARPIKIETLNKKRLAVDASIWIYQFLKAVRDKEGNALRNSHVVGFFRRICKLLFFGIKPVFVFDGGAPALKRQTISSRKSRREGRREDAVRTAGKLLALQMQRRAEEAEQERREANSRPQDREEEEVPENPVYVDELAMTEQERAQGRKFKKKDQYHLPELNSSLAEMGQPNDPRVMSLEELEQYARQFDTGEDINVYDFSKIDFNSPFFQSLPPADRYNILNAARLRSRLRMGYSKDQLEDMFPDRMAFSRFQIDRVKERNELTQRLMNLNGMNDGMDGVEGTGRIAGEKGREYVLVRSSGAEGGWALGVIGDKSQGDRSKPIDVDEIDRKPKEEEDDSEDDLGFEDVPVEGLNRLPRVKKPTVPTSKISTADILRRREGHYRSRKAGAYQAPQQNKSAQAQHRPAPTEDDDDLFVDGGTGETVEFQGVQTADEDDDEAELQRAIALSLEKDDKESSPEADEWEEVLQKPVADRRPEQNAGGFMRPGPFDEGDDAEDMDLINALAQSRQGNQHTQSEDMAKAVAGEPTTKQHESQNGSDTQKFDGPLPFETLDLGSSLLGKKKMRKVEEAQAGGFVKASDSDASKKATPLPPWFKGDLKEDMEAQKAVEDEDRARARREREQAQFDFDDKPRLRTQDTNEVIDVDALDSRIDDKDNEDVISIASDGDQVEREGKAVDVVPEDTEVRMGDLADLVRAEPPTAADVAAVDQEVDQAPNAKSRASEASEAEPESPAKSRQQPPVPVSVSPATKPDHLPPQDSDDEALEWEESDHEEQAAASEHQSSAVKPAGGNIQSQRPRSLSIDFEDPDADNGQPQKEPPVMMRRETLDDDEDYLLPKSAAADQKAQPAADSDDEHFFSEEEDEELLLQMTTEAEEHARFASQLNQNKNPRQNIEEYERELKALRNQQKKDRRDADEVTHTMVTECQQLLKLFGLPYITAPMEAEAQCAELVTLGLVDGIVTDDSDCFLFGGTRIYKNMFNQAKFVECYLVSDFEREFDLTREKMIRIAHLLGSDYTEGLPGIGPVTALEIISEFPDSLTDFRDWWSGVQMAAPVTEEDNASAWRRKFRRNAAKIFLPSAFPDARVQQAYLKPEVDSDPSVFQWGVPDLDALRSFLMATIGWTQERTDEVLVPVVRDMNRRENEGTQANITAFLGGAVGAGAFAPRRKDMGKSKRMEGALEKLASRAREKRKGGGQPRQNGLNVLDDEVAVISKLGSTVLEDNATSKGRNAAGKKRKPVRSLKDMAEADDEEDEADAAPKPKKARTARSKRKKTAAS